MTVLQDIIACLNHVKYLYFYSTEYIELTVYDMDKLVL